MDKEELFQARTNPEFLNYLEETRLDAIKTKNISALYEVLDSFLILDLEEEKVNELYQMILQIAFENVQERVNNEEKLTLEGDDLFYVRAFYEHGVEKWSYSNLDGAKELLFVLSNIVNDKMLIEALQAHIIAISKNIDLDSFYDQEVNLDAVDIKEEHGYFITSFKYDITKHLEDNKDVLKEQFDSLKHLLDN